MLQDYIRLLFKKRNHPDFSLNAQPMFYIKSNLLYKLFNNLYSFNERKIIEIIQDRAYSTTFYADKKQKKCYVDHIFRSKSKKMQIYLVSCV